MNNHRLKIQRWSTSSFSSPPDTSPMELAALRRHLDRCEGQRGRFFGLKCARDALDRFIAPRVVTTLVLFAVVGVIVSLLI